MPHPRKKRGRMSESHERETRSSAIKLMERLRLAIEEVIQHDDVMRPIIIRPRRSIAARDPYSCDPCVAKDDAEEGKTSIARRGRDEAAEYQTPAGAEAFDQRAGFVVSVIIARPAHQ